MGSAQTKQLGGFRVCNFGENSLGRLLELEVSFDYIVGIDGVPLTQVSDASHDFFLKRLKGIGTHPVKINVYNSLSTRIRTIVLNPHKSNEQPQEAVSAGRRSSAEPEKDGPRKNIFTYGIESGMIEFDAPLNSLRVYQFLSSDQRVSGLGVGVHWEEISAKGIRVVNVQESSPAQASGLVSNDDFIVASSTLMRPFYSTDDFLVFVKKNDNVPLSLTVYNTETEVTREISITPNSRWGGKGLLGCDIAAGPIYDIPLREKEVSFSKPHQGKITYIEIVPDGKDGLGPIQYRLKEENEVYSKDILLEEEEEEREDGDSDRRDPETQSAESSRGHPLVKDYSFDSYRTKQPEETSFDEKQDIIERALINTGFPKQPARDAEEAPLSENSRKNAGNPPNSSENCTLESLLIISNLDEKKPGAHPKTSCTISDEDGDEDGFGDELSESAFRMSHLRQIREVSEPSSSPGPSSYDADHPEAPRGQDPPPLPLLGPPSLPHQTHPDITPNDQSEPPPSSAGDFPAFPRNSEDCINSHLHAKAGNAHIISGHVEREIPPSLGLGVTEDGHQKCGVDCSGDTLVVGLASDNLRSQADETFVSTEAGQQEESLSLTRVRKEDEESRRDKNGQATLPDSADRPTSVLDPLGEKNQGSDFHERTQDMSPEDERAYEILKKLVNVSPRLDYEPPGIIEYTE